MPKKGHKHLGREQTSDSAAHAARRVVLLLGVGHPYRALQELMVDWLCLCEEENNAITPLPCPTAIYPGTTVSGKRRNEYSNLQFHLAQVISASLKQEFIYHK